MASPYFLLQRINYLTIVFNCLNNNDFIKIVYGKTMKYPITVNAPNARAKAKYINIPSNNKR